MVIMCRRHAPNKRSPAQEPCVRGAFATSRRATNKPRRPSRRLADSSRKPCGPRRAAIAVAGVASLAADAAFVLGDRWRMAPRSGMGLPPGSKRRSSSTAHQRKARAGTMMMQSSTSSWCFGGWAPLNSRRGRTPPVRRRCRCPCPGPDPRGGQNSMSSSSISSGSCFAALTHSRSSGIAMIALQ
jgi:hypothetical protein